MRAIGEGLGEALRGEQTMEEAVPRLRALIDHIIITPTTRLRGVDLVVVRKIDEAIRLGLASSNRLRENIKEP